MTCPDCAALRREVEEWRNGLASEVLDKAQWILWRRAGNEALHPDVRNHSFLLASQFKTIFEELRKDAGPALAAHTNDAPSAEGAGVAGAGVEGK